MVSCRQITVVKESLNKGCFCFLYVAKKEKIITLRKLHLNFSYSYFLTKTFVSISRDHHYRHFYPKHTVVAAPARRKNRCSCAVDCGSSSRLSIFKMADDESKTNTVLSWLLAASCSLEALTNILAILVSHPCRCFDCDRKDRNGVFSFIRCQRQLFREQTFSFFTVTRGTFFPFLKVVSSALRF